MTEEQRQDMDKRVIEELIRQGHSRAAAELVCQAKRQYDAALAFVCSLQDPAKEK